MKSVFSLVGKTPWALWMGRLRYPTLFKGALALMAVSWLIPDPLPLLDEMLFTALAMGLAGWKKERSAVPRVVAGKVEGVR